MEGMQKEEKDYKVGIIREIKKKSKIMIVEKEMYVVLKIEERIRVMVYGEIIEKGKKKEIRENERVREEYMGEEEK